MIAHILSHILCFVCRCHLLDHARSIIVQDPDQQRQPLFGNVIFNDLLHWQLNCCDYAFSALLGVMTKEMQVECDNNARKLTMLRYPDGSPIRRFTQVSAVTYLTTARRVTLIFVWIHCLGSGAAMLPRQCRRPALSMLCAMQTMIIASHGRRAYSTQEWTRLYVDTAKEFFGSMQFLMEYKETHDTRPNAPVFKPMQRGYPVGPGGHTVPETDSEGDGGSAPKLPGRGHIELSTKGIPHASVHFPEQLQWAGHIHMFDTCAPEAAHKLNIKKAMDRVKKEDESRTSMSMMHWMIRTNTWRKIITDISRDEDKSSQKMSRKKKRVILKGLVNESKKHNTLSPLCGGGNSLMCQDVRVSYYEVCHIRNNILSHI